MSGCFGLGDPSVDLFNVPWIQASIIAVSDDNQNSDTVSFPFSSMITKLSNMCTSDPVTSLANSNFYLRTVLFGEDCIYSDASSGVTIFTPDSPADMGPPGCSSTNPDFVQWAFISCDSACLCSIPANGRTGNYGSNTVVGFGEGCLGSWQVTNGWETGGGYRLGLFSGGDHIVFVELVESGYIL